VGWSAAGEKEWRAVVQTFGTACGSKFRTHVHIAAENRMNAPKRSNLTAKSLGIEIESGREREIFKWFLASFLFGKRIQQQVAERTYRVLVDRYGCDTPEKLGRHSWQELVDMLGEGHYVRYDESTAERLLKMCAKLKHEYGGKLSRIRDSSKNRRDLEQRLLEFEGIGPKTVEIFMREARKIWR
jgi:endonuclease III